MTVSQAVKQLHETHDRIKNREEDEFSWTDRENLLRARDLLERQRKLIATLEAENQRLGDDVMRLRTALQKHPGPFEGQVPLPIPDGECRPYQEPEPKFCGECGTVIEPGHMGVLDVELVSGYCSQFCREAKTVNEQRLLDLIVD